MGRFQVGVEINYIVCIEHRSYRVDACNPNEAYWKARDICMREVLDEYEFVWAVRVLTVYEI